VGSVAGEHQFVVGDVEHLVELAPFEALEEPTVEFLVDVTDAGLPIQCDSPPAPTTATRCSPEYERMASPSAFPNS